MCKNYHNVTHAVRRGAEVFVDTTKVNFMCESVPIAGPALAGQHGKTDYKLVDSVKQKVDKEIWGWFCTVGYFS